MSNASCGPLKGMPLTTAFILSKRRKTYFEILPVRWKEVCSTCVVKGNVIGEKLARSPNTTLLVFGIQRALGFILYYFQLGALKSLAKSSVHNGVRLFENFLISFLKIAAFELSKILLCLKLLE